MPYTVILFQAEQLMAEAPPYNACYMPNRTWVQIGIWGDEVEWFLSTLKSDWRMLELGTGRGATTAIFSYFVSQIVTVDVFRFDPINISPDPDFKERWTDYSLQQVYDSLKWNPKIVLLVGKTHDVVPCLQDNYFDLVFIDANHTYEGVKGDFRAAYPKLKDTGIFVFHDYKLTPEQEANVKDLDYNEHNYGVPQLVGEICDPSKVLRVSCSAVINKADLYPID